MPKLYRKKQLIEVERWSPGVDMEGVAIGELDKKNGSPKDGDRIARDPQNPSDRWLISQEYFKRSYEEA